MLIALAPASNSFAAITPSNGSMVSAANTLPRGAVFLPDQGGANPAIGHWWVSDSVLGICELMPSGALPPLPPFVLQNCNGTAKSGAQIVVGPIAAALQPSFPAGSSFVYVADNSSKSIHVVRFVFNPAGNGGFTTNTAFNITNVTATGGGTGGGRPTGIALLPHNGLAANGGKWDLYVGYKASGDIIRVDGVDAITNNINNPPQAKVGNTSDGRGVNALLAFGNDLYLAEIGGFGLSRIADPSGVTRPACSATSVCTAVSLSPQPDFFPGGLATNYVAAWGVQNPTTGKYIFIGDAQLGVTANKVLRYDPATGITELYSQNISPTYVSGGVTYSQYIGVLGLGYNPATGDLYAGDDPQFSAATPVLQQGHIWKIPLPVAAPSVTALSPTSNPDNTKSILVTITGTGFSTVAGATTVNFTPVAGGAATPGTGVVCASVTSCTVNTPIGLLGTFDVTVVVGGLTSAISLADQFTFFAPPPPSAVNVTGVVPNSGATIGGTTVTITGSGFSTVAGGTSIRFGANQATGVTCASTTSCTATSPAGAAGPVDVQATVGVNTSPANPPGDVFNYGTPTANFYAWGITAPKGGAAWLPADANTVGSTGHWWSSDHAQGLCRQDVFIPASPGVLAQAAINFAVCGDDLVGSAGQAVYDPRPVQNLVTLANVPCAVGASATCFLHYVYVPDNAVKSTAVWRLTYDPFLEKMVADPNGGAMATAMTPLADVRTLKPNGMALGPVNPDGSVPANASLYVTDLVEPNVRTITNPNGDPRTQVISIVAQTGDLRGANGTQGFIGNLLYISGNRATQFFDVTAGCPILNANGTTTPCGMASVPAPTGIFVAGSMTDNHTDLVTGAVYKFVYISASPGAANATIYRYDASKDVYVRFAAGSVAPDAFGVVTCPSCTVGSQAVTYITGGNLPGPTTPNGTVWCAVASAASASSPATIGCQRPWDQTNHPTALTATTVPASFSFAFGLGMDPAGNLAITEDPSAGARSGRGTMWIVPFLR